MGNAKSTDKLINAGDVVIEDIRLISYNGFEMDVRRLLVAFTIYEDIYANGLSGYIVLTDSLNLVKNFPIIGEEEIVLRFKTPGVDNDPKTVRLKVFKVGNQLQGDPGQITTVLKLEFISPAVMLSNVTKLNRVMNGMSYSDMVFSIYGDMQKSNNNLPPIVVEETAGKASVIIPYWTPFYAINWMAYRSTSKSDSMASDYLFYQTLDGYNFRSLSTLKRKDSVATYKNIPAGSREPNTSDRLIERELRSIMQHTIVDVHDTMKRSNLGMYSSTQLVHEMTTKSYYGNSYSYRTAFDRISHLNDNRITVYDNPLQELPYTYMKYHTKNYYSFRGVDDANFVDRSLLRQAQMNLMNSFTMSLHVFGDTSIRVGDVITLEFTSPEDASKTNEDTDRYLSGRYMIVSICHEYRQGMHEMLMTVARDSYLEPIPDTKQKEISFS